MSPLTFSLAVRRRMLRSLAVFLTLTIPFLQSRGQHAGTFKIGNREVNRDWLNEEVDRMIDSVGVPGLSFAVFDDGKLVFYNAYGKRNIAGATADKRTVFEACSLSKTFLVYVAHSLVDEGKLDLDKPLYQYLPNPRLEHDPRYKSITARMVLAHCSGIENWQGENNPDTLEIVSNPGTRFVYSGEGYQYLDQVITSIIHQPFLTYMHERVIEPLGLKRSYFVFRKNAIPLFSKWSPGNYANGHWKFGEEVPKYKNTSPVPAAFDHVTASDYARLIIQIFNSGSLTANSQKDIVTPMVRIKSNDPTFGMGEGFGVIYSGNDTIITQNGSNTGFKAAVFYSVVSKKGFVYFSNSDRGILLARRLNEMTTGLDLNHFFADDDWEQYPSQAIDLLKVYRDGGAEALLARLESMKDGRQLQEHALSQLADDFEYFDDRVIRGVLAIYTALYPRSSNAFQMLGEYYMSIHQYDSAELNFEKSSGLASDPGVVAYDLRRCRAKLPLLDIDKRKSLIAKIRDDGTTLLRAEDYNAMFGIDVGKAKDGDSNCYVTQTAPGQWMDYRLDVPGANTYTVRLRVGRVWRQTRLELQSGKEELATLHIPPEKASEKWETLTTKVKLQAGIQTIRLYIGMGNIDLNWIEFAPEGRGKDRSLVSK